ncbi:hypothetical protein HQO90_16650 [Rhodococcus fascians]|nr:hypothetical protein [Rhodococcus fascians]
MSRPARGLGCRLLDVGSANATTDQHGNERADQQPHGNDADNPPHESHS